MKIPVIDASKRNNGTIYGYATTERGAFRVARKYFADPVVMIRKAVWTPNQHAFLALTAIGLGDDPRNFVVRGYK